MPTSGELWRRLWYFLNRARFERELHEEMEAHRAEKALAGGAGPRFGNSLRLREEAADQWGWAWFDRLSQDLRFAARLLRRAPAFTLTAIAVLALGVGINLAAFQVFDMVALSSLPIRSPETLVKLYRRSPQGTGTSFSYPAFDFYRSKTTSLAQCIAMVAGTVTLGDDTTRVAGVDFVTTNYFSDLGATPIAGRLLDPADERPQADPVVVLAERIWLSRFGGNPSIVGSRLRINGHPFTVAGIVPASFVGVGEREVAAWIPITQHGAAFTGSALLEDWAASGPVRFYARLNTGVSARAAEAELAPLAAALRTLRPAEVREGEWLPLRPAGRLVALDESGAGFALAGALVALVLVTACVNLGLLVLARTLGRAREFAIRLSVGATRGRVMRQLLTEHLLLGLLGASVGCLVSAAATRILLAATGIPPGLTPHFNLRVVSMAALLAIVTSVLFGFAPALQSMRPSAPRRLRLRSVLIGVQVAAASVLLIVSGLLVRGITHVVRVPLGFDYRQLVLVDPALGSHGRKPGPAQAYWRDLDTRLRQVPGVADVALSSLPPFGNRVTINKDRTVFYHVTPPFFATMGIPLRRGRLLTAGDRDAVLVSETLARRRWPGADPIGQTFNEATVVGVVGDARSVRISDGSTTECYQPIEPVHLPDAVMLVRVAGAPADTSGIIGSLARTVDPRMAPTVTLLTDALQEKLETPRQVAMIASALGLCALLLAVTGLGGMISFTVSQRLKEIGVRLALGARPAHITLAMARQFARPVACGAVAGSGLAVLVATVLSRELFGVSRLDPLAHGGALLLFTVVAAAAALPSLRRALRVDPVTTLRHE
jgi:predicted permease